MQDKRYQVFISSTYTDLRDERQKVMQAVMEMDCFPAGMELFPAMDEDQLDFIKKVIDDCDYYIIIIGGRYGNVTPDGVSYTEAEYEYAVSRGIKVIALLHGEPEQIPQGKSEPSDKGRERLALFRKKVATGRLVKQWTQSHELPGLVALSLSKTIKAHPAKGWIRGDSAASADVLAQINELRLENRRLVQEVEKERSKSAATLAGLAHGSDTLDVFGRYPNKGSWKGTCSWDELFARIGPKMLVPLAQDNVGTAVVAALAPGTKITVSPVSVETIGLQFKALGLITLRPMPSVNQTWHVFWQLTDRGLEHLTALRVRRRPSLSLTAEPDTGDSGGDSASRPPGA